MRRDERIEQERRCEERKGKKRRRGKRGKETERAVSFKPTLVFLFPANAHLPIVLLCRSPASHTH